MRCVTCRQGRMQQGTATLLLERDGRTEIIRRVPALVCENCGEEYVHETAAAVLSGAERAVHEVAGVVIRDFASV